jgi:hypothetical protein
MEIDVWEGRQGVGGCQTGTSEGAYMGSGRQKTALHRVNNRKVSNMMLPTQLQLQRTPV